MFSHKWLLPLSETHIRVNHQGFKENFQWGSRYKKKSAGETQKDLLRQYIYIIIYICMYMTLSQHLLEWITYPNFNLPNPFRFRSANPHDSLAPPHSLCWIVCGCFRLPVRSAELFFFFSTAVVFANPDMLVSFLMFFSETPTLDGYFNLLVFCYKHFWAGLPKIDQHNSVASLVLWWPRQALNVLTILPVTCQCGETT